LTYFVSIDNINSTVLETPHVVVGAAIATKIVNPALALPLAFASHFILETIPHWNPHLNTETEKYGQPTPATTKIVILDLIASLTLGGYIALRALPNTSHALTILAACFMASLPDTVEAPYFFFHIRNETLKKWIKFQKSIQEDTTILPGLISQGLIIIAAFWWILS